MKQDDPRRLLDPRSDAPPWLREALSAARDVGPDADDLARIAAGLPLGHGPTGSGEGGPPPPDAIAPPPSVLSGALVGAALGVVVSAVGLLWGGAGSAPSPREREAATASVAMEPAALPIQAPLPSPSQDAIAPPAPSPSPRPRAPVASTEVAPRAPPPEPTAVAPDAESEVRLLQRARAALDGAPAEALSLAQQHAARFPSGALAQEREVVAIKAMLRLGREAEARARASRFVASFPGSAHRPGLEALFGR
jgi:hypothetical protein